MIKAYNLKNAGEVLDRDWLEEDEVKERNDEWVLGEVVHRQEHEFGGGVQVACSLEGPRCFGHLDPAHERHVVVYKHHLVWLVAAALRPSVSLQLRKTSLTVEGFVDAQFEELGHLPLNGNQVERVVIHHQNLRAMAWKGFLRKVNPDLFMG